MSSDLEVGAKAVDAFIPTGCPLLAAASAQECRRFSYWSYLALIACAFVAMGLMMGSAGCSAHSECQPRQGSLELLAPAIAAAIACAAACVFWTRAFILRPDGTGFWRVLASALATGVLLGVGLSF